MKGSKMKFANVLRLVLILIVGSFFVGCAGVDTLTGPTYLDWESGKPKFDAKVVYKNPGVFVPSGSDTHSLGCIPPAPFVATDPDGTQHIELVTVKDEELLAVSKCQQTAKVKHDIASPVASGFIAPVLNSVSNAYIGHEIGKGIGNSGDRNTFTDNSEVNSDNTQKAKQGQGQGQLQGQLQGQSSHSNSNATNRTKVRNSNSNSNSNQNSNRNTNSNSGNNGGNGGQGGYGGTGGQGGHGGQAGQGGRGGSSSSSSRNCSGWGSC